VGLLLIDTDPGVDDALALLLAWSSPEARVEAITTVAGNVPLPLATANLLRLVSLRQPSPAAAMAAGAAAPLARPLVTAAHYHGPDGLGGLDDWPDVAGLPAGPDAADLIVETARRHRGGLTLIALGPLTNVALALERDAAAVAAIGRVVVMGGAVDVPGNVTPGAEFNVHVDPEAAARVLEARLPLDLVPLDATRQARVERGALEAALARRPGPLASRVAALTAHAFEREQGRMTLHDPLAVGAATDASLVQWEAVRLAVGPGGETRRVAGPPNCRVARAVDRGRFLGLFLDRVGRPA
jgi:purine nucleosidase/pyrimidine-specific ribonucleoside hydrolase